MYYRGMETDHIKPITTGRTTEIRRKSEHLHRLRGRHHPIRARGPMNFRGFHHPGEPTSSASTKRTAKTHIEQAVVKAHAGASLSSPVELDMSLSPGQSFLGDDIVPTSTSFWNPFKSIVDLWNDRPEAVKKIRFRINPHKAASAAQKFIPPSQVDKAVDYAKKFGFDPSYLTQAGEVPITGGGMSGLYKLESFDWSAWMPWILGGGGLLVAGALLLRRK